MFSCPSGSLVARHGTASSSIQCYSVPQRANAALAALSRLENQQDENVGNAGYVAGQAQGLVGGAGLLLGVLVEHE